MGRITCPAMEASASPPGSARSNSQLIIPVLKLLLAVSCSMLLSMKLSAGEPAPKITISKKNTTLQELFKEIQKQTQYAFVYNNEMMRETKKLSIDVKDASLEHVLNICFKDQPVTYSIVDKIVVVRKKGEEKETYSDTARNKSEAALMTIRGTITDDQSIPIAKASVVAKNKKAATSTDNKGDFILTNVPLNTTLLISCIGYEPAVVAVKKNEEIRVNLKVAPNNLNETIVVAYNSTTQRANTGAVSVVKGEQIQTLPNRSFDKSLQGLVPGLVVTNGSGQPGGAPANFVLRGVATGGNPLFGETFRNPLIVIDGVPVTQDPMGSSSMQNQGRPSVTNPMSLINPSDIESISVLKDAAAASLYGSKASNGVIIVTTKKGKAGKTNYNFRHQTDISTRIEKNTSVLNQQQYLDMIMETYRNSFPTASDDSIRTDLYKKFPTIVKSPGDTSFYPASNWIDAIYDNRAITTSNELNISGGTAKTTFYLNFEYTKQNGIVSKTDFDRKSMRFNVENRLASWFKLGLNTSFAYSVQNYSNNTGSEMYISPLLPIKNMNGNYINNFIWGYGIGGVRNSLPNPVAAAEKNINRNTSYGGISALTASITPFKSLTFNSKVGFNFILNEAKQKIHPDFIIQGDTAAGLGRITDENYRSISLINSNTLLFSQEIAPNHQLQLLAGQEAQIKTDRYLNSNIKGFGSNPSLEEIQGGTNIQTFGKKFRQTLLSYFGQFSYGYKEKYFLSGSIRADGASKFGKNAKFGTFWSVGAGWLVSEEPIIKKALPWLNLFKIRGSYGSSGNSSAITDGIRFDPLVIYNYLGSTAVWTQGSASPSNPGIQWESTKTMNIGVELGMLDNRVMLKADFYNRKTNNLIAYDILIPGATGYSTFTDNIGDISNKGIELSFSVTPVRTRDFSWTLTGNWSKNTNRLTKSFYPSLTVFGNGNLVNEVGKEYNSFYLPIWAGVNPSNGRPQWIDSSSGKPTEDYKAAKKEIVGNAQPDGVGSLINTLTYKGFELSFNLYYQYGSEIYFEAGRTLINDGALPYMNQISSAQNRWKKTGANSPNPRRLLNGVKQIPTYPGLEFDYGGEPSTRYLYNGDFLRLSNVNIAYTFPVKMISKLHMSSLRLYVQGNNLAVWTKYSNGDPENINAFGSSVLLYPLARSFSIGAMVGF
ncbi:SusC/RagA family TonB-linked outer membrane protein [Pseudoflavitalea sp. G-6-1-2]|uniref:SusC/RagA family TonB-linked outer membrane protein n=1 Tax=Pseudoflavitalea sp. G-6-1-2 TaxID=2728841 RepID=UPI00146CB861|nr:SusC/RagA family TonB-linked outer membrane protein [Pseudoflavitalea sp. G-6-1-2]NML22972.1 SusC/RagA family TonB-linked outer membrane protein [Pseudoflavitalea sp. G-6-1-2]